MGLNPGRLGLPSQKQIEMRRAVLDDCFNGGSPYFDMFRCGYYGVPIEECISKCNLNKIAIRKKDIQSWEDGNFKRGMSAGGIFDTSSVRVNKTFIEYGKQLNDLKLTDFPKFPISWTGSERRFFPCTDANKPIGRWGWSEDYTPNLYTIEDAKALSPVGWVGQNLLYQKFVVLDIDGVGHGPVDTKVIEWGSQFKSMTKVMEDPEKPGSFHLYFTTDRIIPVRHFTWAKLDLMGNAVNAAVYIKNKKWNGIEPAELTDDIWQSMIEYQKIRKEELL